MIRVSRARSKPAMLAAILVVVLAGWTAGAASAGEGSAVYDFLRIVPGARSAALGDAYLVLNNDAEGLAANPAGMVQLLNPQVGFSHVLWWEDVSYDAAWGVQPLGTFGAVGVSAAYLHVPAFNSTPDPELASDGAWGLAAGVAYAFKPWRNLALGSHIRVIGNALDGDQSWGAALDAGMHYFLSNDQLVLAAVVQNLGFASPYLEETDPLPLAAAAGAAYHFWPDEANRLSLGLAATLPLAGRPVISLGAEGWIWNTLALRAGVRSDTDTGSWLTAGAGVRWQNVHLDYAVAPLGLLGATHRLSVGYDFGSQRRLARPKLRMELVTKHFVDADGQPAYEVQFIPRVVVAAGVQRWDLLITDAQGNSLRAFGAEGAPPMSVTWNGKDEAGKRVDVEAYYTYRFTLADRLGYRVQVEGDILPVSITKLPKLKAIPRDIYAGRVTFTPHTGKNIKEWSIMVVDPEGRILKKYQGVGMIPKEFAWDGSDENQKPVVVTEGFQFVVRVKDRKGNELESTAPLIVVDAGTKAYTKTGVPLLEQVPIHFHFEMNNPIQSWALDVIDNQDKKIVRSYTGAGPLPETLNWDSRDEQGRLVPTDRSYTTMLRVQDMIGNIWRQSAPLGQTLVRVLDRQEHEIRIKIEQILFDFNKAELKPDMVEKVRKIADLARMYPPDQVSIIIQGHTDEIGSADYNQELSLNRSRMVMRYLIEEEGLRSSMLEVQGFGKTQPVVSGSSAEARAQNRRVEVILRLPQ